MPAETSQRILNYFSETIKIIVTVTPSIVLIELLKLKYEDETGEKNYCRRHRKRTSNMVGIFK